jgi:hypothetical protein
MEETLVFLNEKKRDKESIQRVVEIDSTLINKPAVRTRFCSRCFRDAHLSNNACQGFDLVTPNRRFISENVFYMCRKDSLPRRQVS